MLAAAHPERRSQPRRICLLCVEMLGVDGAGIAVVTTPETWGTFCVTDEVSGRLADLQHSVGEGPGIDAGVSGTPVLVADLDRLGDLAVERWPAFVDGALAAGARAVFAFPLQVGAIRLGVLEFYRREAGGLDESRLSAALLAADAAGLALLRLGDGAEGLEDDDAQSLFRPEIHQATGMVQVQLGVTTAEALVILRARAFADGTTLAEVAAAVVGRTLRFTTEDR